MTEIWMLAAVWFGLALLASLISSWLRVTSAVVEISVGVLAGFLFAVFFDPQWLGADQDWILFLAGAGAIMLTFLAGVELDPSVFRDHWREAGLVGLSSFLVPFAGCALGAYYGFGWSMKASLIAGIAMSCTSVAVVYSAMLDHGFNRTTYGKVVLAACFITDLASALVLALLFAPIDWKTLLFVVAAIAAFFLMPRITPRLLKKLGDRPAELETKYLMLALFGLGALASFAGSQAILPAYVLGVVLAGTLGHDRALIRRLRTLTFGFLTPIFFIRAGTMMSLPALIAAPGAFLAMLSLKMVTKSAAVYPLVRAFGSPQKEASYTTLLMSAGLTFGAVASIYGLQHGVIDQTQYSILIASIIASAVVPTIIANAYFVPHHLKPPQPAPQPS